MPVQVTAQQTKVCWLHTVYLAETPFLGTSVSELKYQVDVWSATSSEAVSVTSSSQQKATLRAVPVFAQKRLVWASMLQRLGMPVTKVACSLPCYCQQHAIVAVTARAAPASCQQAHHHVCDCNVECWYSWRLQASAESCSCSWQVSRGAHVFGVSFVACKVGLEQTPGKVQFCVISWNGWIPKCVAQSVAQTIWCVPYICVRSFIHGPLAHMYNVMQVNWPIALWSAKLPVRHNLVSTIVLAGKQPACQ